MQIPFISGAGEQIVSVTAGSAKLVGNLVVPQGAEGMVVLACGSNSRYNPRNYYMAHLLRQSGLATLLLDVLTAEEAAIDARAKHFYGDIRLLATRLVGITDWLIQSSLTHALKIGYFGIGTSGGAALIAAAERTEAIGAVISQSGYLDLVGSALSCVQAPTLLIVGEQDFPAIATHQDAFTQLHSPKQLAIVPKASHLFKEPGALEESIRLASLWFTRYLTCRDRFSNSPAKPDSQHANIYSTSQMNRAQRVG